MIPYFDFLYEHEYDDAPVWLRVVGDYLEARTPNAWVRLFQLHNVTSDAPKVLCLTQKQLREISGQLHLASGKNSAAYLAANRLIIHADPLGVESFIDLTPYLMVKRELPLELPDFSDDCQALSVPSEWLDEMPDTSISQIGDLVKFERGFFYCTDGSVMVVFGNAYKGEAIYLNYDILKILQSNRTTSWCISVLHRSAAEDYHEVIIGQPGHFKIRYAIGTGWPRLSLPDAPIFTVDINCRSLKCFLDAIPGDDTAEVILRADTKGLKAYHKKSYVRGLLSSTPIMGEPSYCKVQSQYLRLICNYYLGSPLARLSFSGTRQALFISDPERERPEQSDYQLYIMPLIWEDSDIAFIEGRNPATSS